MNIRLARFVAALLFIAVTAVWAWIIRIAADPGSGWGAAWFELALTNFAATILALLACYVLWQPAAWRLPLARAALSVAAILLAAALMRCRRWSA